MTRRAHEAATAAVVRDLIASFSDHPGALAVDVAAVGQDTLFTVRPSPKDKGKVIGRKGCHVRALKAIAGAAGARAGATYLLVVVDGADKNGEPNRGDEYDPNRIADILARTVQLVAGSGPVAAVDAVNPQSFTFTIRASSPEDLRVLGCCVEAGTLAGAIDTLLRAHAGREGVKFRSQIIPP